ncbi:PREDICTED: larval cuticle protein A3A-like [Trachymyrmex cornetzi]|uniref:larval cuticle protein A3A-like n=1 Tax=Trachymyrmex cornetzi TaxID=471704 RepID=UPI00084EEA80|nr:PREDICTED: larval cuticle protein A3A-like [Trachymyrmex cornetzi]
MTSELVLFASMFSTLLLIDAKPEGYAHSFQHFLGPVTGTEHEVSWNDDDGFHEDYVAQPHYAFSYGIEDYHTGDYHGQKEHRDGSDVFGEYTVKEPDGNIRTVKYRAGRDGFHAKVLNSHRNDRQQDVDHHYDHY